VRGPACHAEVRCHLKRRLKRPAILHSTVSLTCRVSHQDLGHEMTRFVLPQHCQDLVIDSVVVAV